MVIPFEKLPKKQFAEDVEAFMKKWEKSNMKEEDLIKELPEPLTDEQIDAIIGEWDAKLFHTIVALLQDEHGISSENWDKLNELLNQLGGLESQIMYLRVNVKAINGRVYLPEETK